MSRPSPSVLSRSPSRWFARVGLLMMAALLVLWIGTMGVAALEVTRSSAASDQVRDLLTTVEVMYDRGVVDSDTPVEEVAAAVLEYAELDDSPTRDGFRFTAVNGQVEIDWRVDVPFSHDSCQAIQVGGEPTRCARSPETPDWADPLLENAEPGPQRVPIEAVEPSERVRAAFETGGAH